MGLRLNNLTAGWRWLLIIGSVAFLMVFMGAKDAAVPAKLKVTELEVVDADGKARVVIGPITKEEGGHDGFFCARFINADEDVVVVINNDGKIIVRNDKEKLGTVVLPRGVDKLTFRGLEAPGGKPPAPKPLGQNPG